MVISISCRRRSAPGRSDLLTTKTSAISMSPAFIVWIASPDSGTSTTADRGEGIEELVKAFDRHFDYLERSGMLRSRRRQRLRERVVEVVERRVRERLWRDQETNAWLDDALPALDEGSLTPFAAAEALLERSVELITRGRRS